MNMPEIGYKIGNWMAKQPKKIIVVFGLAILIVIGITDYLTGIYLSLLIFYLIPVLLVSWFAGFKAGILISFLCALTWSSEDIIKSQSLMHPLIPYWNIGADFVVFLIISFSIYTIKQSLIREKERALIDDLTGIGNRRFFYEFASNEIKRAQRYNHQLTLIYLDLNNFKAVNDKFGHHKGDEVLKSVAKTMKSGMRSIDIIARFGGDEFVALLPETGFDGARKVIDRIKNDIDTIVGKENPVSASIGAVTLEKPAGSIDDLIKSAEALMYEEKRSEKKLIRHKIA